MNNSSHNELMLTATKICHAALLTGGWHYELIMLQSQSAALQ